MTFTEGTGMSSYASSPLLCASFVFEGYAGPQRAGAGHTGSVLDEANANMSA